MQTMQRAQWQRHSCHATNGASVRDVTDDKEYAGSMCRWNKQANKQCIDLSGLVQCSTCGRHAQVEKVVKQQGRLQLLELPAVSRLRSKAHLELRKRSFGGLHVQGGPCVWCEEHVPQGSSMCSKPVHALRRLGVPSATNYWDTPPDVDNSVQLRLTVTGVDQQLRDCGELEVDVSVESCYPLLLPDDCTLQQP
ncbi:hypothetical protein AB1Y20_014926 [Prymnesium parvum]|uniref:Uncharacterized protein n=1 Tax=Prymnesium parvum TaxID=97485 RepID=A0AB34JWC4_PRYPA